MSNLGFHGGKRQSTTVTHSITNRIITMGFVVLLRSSPSSSSSLFRLPLFFFFLVFYFFVLEEVEGRVFLGGGEEAVVSSSSSSFLSGRLRERSFSGMKELLVVSDDEDDEDDDEKEEQRLDRASGYFKLDRTTRDAHMFYMFFSARRKEWPSLPVVLWMTGGPGCSSEIAAFSENGPFEVVEMKKRNATEGEAITYGLKKTKFGWDVEANLLYVDQPCETGFSYSNDPEEDEARDETTVANDMLEFLQDFFLSRPGLADNDFFVTGESYAGHYVPVVAHRIFEASRNDEGSVRINLKGFAIGNGLTDPLVQYPAYAKYAAGVGIVTQD